MKFYKSIAKYYDYIFPYNSIQKDFVLSAAGDENRNKSILDIGCGTGNLTLELSKGFKNVIGIDYDRDMIRMAKSKVAGYGNSINFRCLNMIEIKNHFRLAEFDLILSFGNTLVHLKNVNEVRCFLDKTKKILKPGGKLLLQIVNFDRVLRNNIKSLPLIENETVKFERYYSYHRQQRFIDFKTILTVKKENRVIENSVQLVPLLKKEVEDILKNIGFEKVFFYGGFKKEGFTQHSPPLIIEAY
jgi:2-polyprenyl-3-methyl-5-hydroxy-6-metoxy-1,4-benzoquinol methylase